MRLDYSTTDFVISTRLPLWSAETSIIEIASSNKNPGRGYHSSSIKISRLQLKRLVSLSKILDIESG
jgi:hypothetical protein